MTTNFGDVRMHHFVEFEDEQARKYPQPVESRSLCDLDSIPEDIRRFRFDSKIKIVILPEKNPDYTHDTEGLDPSVMYHVIRPGDAEPTVGWVEEKDIHPNLIKAGIRIFTNSLPKPVDGITP